MKVNNATGSTMNRMEKLFHPPAGSQPRPMANTSINTGPITKDGKTLPTLLINMTTWSTMLFCRSAAQMPAAVPISQRQHHGCAADSQGNR